MNIAIYCPNSLEEWDDTSLERGIGASESAVIYLSRELAKGGHRVNVYNSVEERRDFDAVTYLPCSEREYIGEYSLDALIVWRHAESIVTDLKHVKAKTKVLWLHDAVPEIEILPYIYLYDLIVVQSSYHRSLYPSVPDSRITVIPCGIDAALFVPGETRDPWKLVHFSNYDRGLHVLLENWTRLKLTFPDLTLTVGYGWDTLESLATRQGGDSLKSFRWFKAYMENLLDQDGITHLGRVSQAEVARHMGEANIWAYPCEYPETLCVTALQAQAAGAVPVVMPKAALAETVKAGFLANTPVEWVDRLIHALANPAEADELRALCLAAAPAFAWEKVAARWQEALARV